MMATFLCQAKLCSFFFWESCLLVACLQVAYQIERESHFFSKLELLSKPSFYIRLSSKAAAELLHGNWVHSRRSNISVGIHIIWSFDEGDMAARLWQTVGFSILIINVMTKAQWIGERLLPTYLIPSTFWRANWGLTFGQTMIKCVQPLFV